LKERKRERERERGYAELLQVEEVGEAWTRWWRSGRFPGAAITPQFREDETEPSIRVSRMFI
jgi:hypothetical protein